MPTRARLLAGSIAAALLVTAVQTATTATTAAAPVTCAGFAKVFDTRADGSLWYYEHFAPATGAVSWSGGRQIGTGFTEQFDNPDQATVDSAGRLFLLQRRMEGSRPRGDARTFRYDETSGGWDDPAGTVVQVGWQDYDLIAGAGDNVVYTRDAAGNLYRNRYDQTSQRWTDRRLTGTGWGGFRHIFSPGGDVLYAVSGTALYWYRFDAETGLWANGGGGRQIGTGWGDRRNLSASTDSCTTAAPVAAAAAPLPATIDDPVPTVATGSAVRLFTLNAQGRVVVTTDSANGATTTTLPGPALTGELSVAPRGGGGAQVAGLDAAGRVWHATFDATTWSAFANLGGNLRTVRAVRTTSHELALAGIDPEGRLWVRVEEEATDLGWWHLPGPALTGELTLAGSDDDLNGTAFRRDGTQILFAVYPEAFPDDPRPEATYVFQYLPTFPTEPVAVTNTPDVPRLYAHSGAVGTVRATRWTDWSSLPGQAFAAGQPLSATYIGEFNSAVAGRGPDGRVHVTSQRSHLWDELQTWQPVGTFSSTAPTITYGDRVELTYRGQDGQLHRYSAEPDAVGGPGPLQFTGGPIGG